MKEEVDSCPSEPVTPNVFCQACASPLVQALDWEQESASCWHVRLWCPECGYERAVTLDRPHLFCLSLAIEEGFAWVLEALSEFDAVLSESVSVDLARRARTDRIPSARH